VSGALAATLISYGVVLILTVCSARSFQMQQPRVFGGKRVIVSLAFLGMAAFTPGCGESGGGSSSSLTPATPPPGKSGKEQSDERAKLIPTVKGGPPAGRPR